MNKLNDILHELGISKVKLAKFLGVSRQMIYNYLELDDINKWPKDKKVLLLNLLGIKSAEEIEHLKVDTDYILAVESRLNSLFENSSRYDVKDTNELFENLDKKKKDLLINIVDLIKDELEDSKKESGGAYDTYRYLYHFLQSIDTSKELKYFLAYVAKITGFINPYEFVYNEDEQFKFESIMFSAMTLYSGEGSSKSRLAESHKRFVAQIEQKKEEKLSRTMELNSIKAQALKELNYDKVDEQNASEVWEKMAEIESRKIT